MRRISRRLAALMFGREMAQIMRHEGPDLGVELGLVGGERNRDTKDFRRSVTLGKNADDNPILPNVKLCEHIRGLLARQAPTSSRTSLCTKVGFAVASPRSKSSHLCSPTSRSRTRSARRMTLARGPL